MDIIKLNDYIRSLATEGKKVAKARAVKKHCKSCNKDLKTFKTLKCSSCQDHVHAACVKSLHDENTFRCGPCVVYPAVTQHDDDEGEDVIESLERDTVLPITASKTIEIVDVTKEPETENNTENTDVINYECEECGEKFFNNNNLEVHKTNSHRGTKRHRQDTSLVSDPGQLCDHLNDTINTLTNTLKEAENKVAKLVKDEEENRNRHLNELAKIQEEKILIKAAFDETKQFLDATVKESNEKTDVIDQLKTEIALLRSQKPSNEHLDQVKKKQEELEIVKQMVIDKDKTIKKMTTMILSM